MGSADVQGAFVWHELTSSDASAVASFYAQVLGWQARPWEQDPSYTVWTTPHGAAGGAARWTADGGSSNTAPCWVSFVAVADVEATAAAAERLGGRIVKAASTLPDGGRYAVLADPQSAVIGVFSPQHLSAAASPDFVWHELGTDDQASAFRFYGQLFGWERLGDHDLGAMGTYLIFGRRGERLGGLYSRPPGTIGAPQWLAYVEVASVDEAARATRAAGGRVATEPQRVPGGSWVAHLSDPQGALLAVHQARAAASGDSDASPRVERTSPVRARKATPRRRAAPRRPTRKATVARARSGSRSKASRRSATPRKKGTGGASRRRLARRTAQARGTSRSGARRKRAAARKATVRRGAKRRVLARKPVKRAARSSTASVRRRAKRPASRRLSKNGARSKRKSARRRRR